MSFTVDPDVSISELEKQFARDELEPLFTSLDVEEQAEIETAVCEIYAGENHEPAGRNQIEHNLRIILGVPVIRSFVAVRYSKRDRRTHEELEIGVRVVVSARHDDSRVREHLVYLHPGLDIADDVEWTLRSQANKRADGDIDPHTGKFYQRSSASVKGRRYGRIDTDWVS